MYSEKLILVDDVHSCGNFITDLLKSCMKAKNKTSMVSNNAKLLEYDKADRKQVSFGIVHTSSKNDKNCIIPPLLLIKRSSCKGKATLKTFNSMSISRLFFPVKNMAIVQKFIQSCSSSISTTSTISTESSNQSKPTTKKKSGTGICTILEEGIDSDGCEFIILEGPGKMIFHLITMQQEIENDHDHDDNNNLNDK